MTSANQVLYITQDEYSNLIKMTQTNGEELNIQYNASRLYTNQEWAVTAVLEMRNKR